MPSQDKCGVYAIEQVGTERYYIGSSRRVYRRWYEHKFRLGRGSHQSLFLQNAWSKHGPDAFVFTVLEECDPSDLLAREQAYIDATQPAFNLCPKAGSRQGSKQSPEVRARMSLSQKERLSVRTHCPSGHPYSPENTHIDRDGARRCRECARINTRRAQASWDEERRERNRARLRDRHRRVKGGEVGLANAKKTHCPQGHPYDKGNTMVVGRGRGWGRRCRACDRNRHREYHKRVKAMRGGGPD